MIVFDTNVISELVRESPDERVLLWANHFFGPGIWTTAITLYEMSYGTAKMPPGPLRTKLAEAKRRIIDEVIQNRVLPFDEHAARAAGVLRARLRETDPEPRKERDLMIAGIALAQGLPVATRNVRDFAATGVIVFDPWTA